MSYNETTVTRALELGLNLEQIYKLTTGKKLPESFAGFIKAIYLLKLSDETLNKLGELYNKRYINLVA